MFTRASAGDTHRVAFRCRCEPWPRLSHGEPQQSAAMGYGAAGAEAASHSLARRLRNLCERPRSSTLPVSSVANSGAFAGLPSSSSSSSSPSLSQSVSDAPDSSNAGAHWLTGWPLATVIGQLNRRSLARSLLSMSDRGTPSLSLGICRQQADLSADRNSRRRCPCARCKHRRAQQRRRAFTSSRVSLIPFKRRLVDSCLWRCSLRRAVSGPSRFVGSVQYCCCCRRRKVHSQPALC